MPSTSSQKYEHLRYVSTFRNVCNLEIYTLGNGGDLNESPWGRYEIFIWRIIRHGPQTWLLHRFPNAYFRTRYLAGFLFLAHRVDIGLYRPKLNRHKGNEELFRDTVLYRMPSKLWIQENRIAVPHTRKNCTGPSG